MKNLIIKTQTQLNKIKKDFNGTIFIEGGTEQRPLILKTNFENAEVVVRGEAFLDVRDNAVIQDVWDNAVIQDVRGNAVIKYVWDNAVIQDVWGNAVIQDVWDNAVIQDVWGNAVIKYVRDNAVIQDVRGNAVIKYVRGNAVIKYVRGNAVIQDVWDNAVITLYGEAMVSAYSCKKITCNGYNVVKVNKSNKKNCNIVVNKTSHLIIIPDFKPTFEEYKKRFPVDVKGTKAILYKAVHKIDGKYYSDYDKSMEYKIGETYKHEVVKNNESCGTGIHLATKGWAEAFGSNWDDMALLECETAIKDIYVAKDCDGKIRTSKMKVLKEV